MIIKSMSRKAPSFGQLIGYIDRDEGQEDYRLRHNLLGRNIETMQAEFEQNAELLQKRKNRVYLYHEILSITRARGLTPEQQKAKLREIVQEYISARCPENMVFGGLHQDKDHSYHFHLLISANRAGDTKRHRLTKHQFRDIAVSLENHVLAKYPELEQKVAIGKRADKKLSRGEAELERRTGKRPKREEVLERLRSAFAASHDRDSFFIALGHENLEFNIKSENRKFLSITDLETGKPHRLKTLDLQLADEIEGRLARADAPEQEQATEQGKSSGAKQPQEKTAQDRGFAGEKEKEPEKPREGRGDHSAPEQEESPRQKQAKDWRRSMDELRRDNERNSNKER